MPGEEICHFLTCWRDGQDVNIYGESDNEYVLGGYPGSFAAWAAPKEKIWCPRCGPGAFRKENPSYLDWTPTPTPTLKPRETPQPTRTPYPSPTPVATVVIPTPQSEDEICWDTLTCETPLPEEEGGCGLPPEGLSHGRAQILELSAQFENKPIWFCRFREDHGLYYTHSIYPENQDPDAKVERCGIVMKNRETGLWEAE